MVVCRLRCRLQIADCRLWDSWLGGGVSFNQMVCLHRGREAVNALMVGKVGREAHELENFQKWWVEGGVGCGLFFFFWQRRRMK
jgi:hypothetical protein